MLAQVAQDGSFVHGDMTGVQALQKNCKHNLLQVGTKVNVKQRYTCWLSLRLGGAEEGRAGSASSATSAECSAPSRPTAAAAK